MTTMDVPTIGQFAALHLAKIVARRDKAKQAPRVRTWIESITRLVLTLSGFSFLTYAGFLCHPVAGFVTAGISCFLLSWLMTGSNTRAHQPQPQQDPLMYGRDKR